MKEVIIACDFPNRDDVFTMLDKFRLCKPYLKIGMEMFYKSGTNLVEQLKNRGYKIFLDLKLHDIPNTVESAMKVLAKLNVDMINVHAAGGIEMMKRAKQAVKAYSQADTKVIAVTQLTSTSQQMLNDELLISGQMNDVVKKYAENAITAGLDGVVCSALEAPIINGMGLTSVTPGIRFKENSVDDQKRVVTPEMARKLGSDYIVMGRAITSSSNPLEAYKRAMYDFAGVRI